MNRETVISEYIRLCDKIGSEIDIESLAKLEKSEIDVIFDIYKYNTTIKKEMPE